MNVFVFHAASIVSKKAAESVNALILDTKFGKGAFMKTMEEGRQLAKSLVWTNSCHFLHNATSLSVESETFI